MNKKYIIVGLVAIVIIAIAGYALTHRSVRFGAITGETNYNTVGVTGLKVGSSCGDTFTSTTANGCKSIPHMLTATCSLIADNSITATSTGYAYCTGVTGVTSSDNVLALFSTSTLGQNVVSEGFSIVSAKASSTAGAIDFLIRNESGRAVAPSAAGRIGSTTQLFFFQ